MAFKVANSTIVSSTIIKIAVIKCRNLRHAVRTWRKCSAARHIGKFGTMGARAANQRTVDLSASVARDHS